MWVRRQIKKGGLMERCKKKKEREKEKKNDIFPFVTTWIDLLY